ncbi:hypothetical protein ACNOYE_13345 [Nannocystaceae bacterium ST9]
MSNVILASLLGLAPTTPAEQPAHVELRPGFVLLSPIGVAVPRLGDTSDTRVARENLLPSYRWGFAAGVNFQPARGLLLGVAGSFDHVVWSVRDYRPGDELGSSDAAMPLCFAGDCYGWNERVIGSLLRLGLDMRIGWVSRRWLLWTLLSPHIAVTRLRIDCNDARGAYCDRKHTDVGPGLGAGIGAALRIVSHVAIGLEAEIDHEWLDRTDDPFRAVRTWELDLVALFSF